MTWQSPGGEDRRRGQEGCREGSQDAEQGSDGRPRGQMKWAAGEVERKEVGGGYVLLSEEGGEDTLVASSGKRGLGEDGVRAILQLGEEQLSSRLCVKIIQTINIQGVHAHCLFWVRKSLRAKSLIRQLIKLP